jgi:hypothetical protein
MTVSAHSYGCQVRWAFATFILSPIPIVLYVVLFGDPSAVGEYVEGDVVLALTGLSCSLVAVWLLARRLHFALAVVCTAAAGFIFGYALGVIVLGPEGEAETEGTEYFVAGIAGAFVGMGSTVLAWLLLRLAHRFLSRGTCPPTRWTPPAQSR